MQDIITNNSSELTLVLWAGMITFILYVLLAVWPRSTNNKRKR